MMTIRTPAQPISAPGRIRPWEHGALSVTAMLGGLLWVPYGVFEMLQPWGADAEYRSDPGYEVVTNGFLYRLYNLPGSLALLLVAVSLLGISRHLSLSTGSAMPVSKALAASALALAGIALAGVTAGFDPLFTGPRLLGTTALGAATFLAGVRARRGSEWTAEGSALVALGLLGLFLFPLWPLVYAVGIIPNWLGAAIIALLGLGWVAIGYRHWQRPAVSSVRW